MSYRRKTFIEKCANFLSLNPDDIIVLNMEKGIFNTTVKFIKDSNEQLKWSNPKFTKKYSTIARKILANISYTSNSKEFIHKILSGKIDPYEIATMTKEQMNPEFWAELNLNIMKKYIAKQEEVADGIFTCFKCKSKKTVYYQMQTRSADEPMTSYVTCTNCGTNWKC